MEPSVELQASGGNSTQSRVLRRTKTRTGENIPKTEIHQQDRPQPTGDRPLSERDTGEKNELLLRKSFLRCTQV